MRKNQILKFYKVINKIGFTLDEFQNACRNMAKMGFSIPKIPSLKIYQYHARIYLDEYPEQNEIRKRYFLLRHHYKTNWLYCKEVLEEEGRLMHD